MNIKVKLIEMIGCSSSRLNNIILKYKIDYIELYEILSGDLPLGDKRDYIYSKVSETIGDHWWTYYIDHYYRKEEY